MLPSRREAFRFAVRFTLLLAVYLYPFRPIAEAYSSAAAALGNAFVQGHVWNDTVTLHFGEPLVQLEEPSARDAFNTELVATDARNDANTVKIPIDLRTLAYLPTAVFVALAVAAPIWETGLRGAIVLGAGISLIQIFSALSIAVPLYLFFANPAPMHLVDVPLSVHRVLDVLYRALVAPPGMAYALPALLLLALVWLVPKPVPRAGPPGDARLAA